MPSIIALAVLSAVAASAIPHGHQHFHLHPARSPRNLITHNVEHVGETITPIAGRSELPLDLADGLCGGDTGFGCGEGYCCSKWGYCGVTEDYCGAGCQFGNCNGTATGPTAPASNATAPQPAEYSSVEAAGPVVTVQMTVTATGPAAVVTVTSSTEGESISAAGIATKVHGPPAFSQPWETISAGWGQPESTAAPVATTLATLTSTIPAVVPTPTPYSSVSVPAWTPESSSAAAPVETSTSAAAPAYTTTSAAAPASSGGVGFGNVYITYQGNGDAPTWPSEDEWMSYDDMWSSNLATISGSCAAWSVPDNSDEESAEMKDAISSVAAESGVDERFILAIVMQESKGCVRVISTAGSNGNPGLMQSHEGSGSCNSGSSVQNPCPQSEILQMIKDGTEGTSTGPGLVQLIQQADTDDVSKYYKAARMYNSGNNTAITNLNSLSTVQYGTASYCSDIANRLTGWTTATSTF